MSRFQIAAVSIVALAFPISMAGCAERGNPEPDGVAAAPAKTSLPPTSQADTVPSESDVPVIGMPEAELPDSTPAIAADPPPAPTDAPPAAPVQTLATADAAFATLLNAIVTPAGLVHYELLADPRRESSLDFVIDVYANTAVPGDTPAKLAFFCNAYNANVLSTALRESRKPGFKSVNNVSGFFDRATITVATENLTLNALENDRIRPLGDARIHAALVCAATSCPPLRAEPFDADRLDAQFDDQCARWVSDESKNRAKGDVLELSKIFKWYRSDFEKPPWDGPAGFVAAHASPSSSALALLLREPKPQIRWIDYDWSLNQAPRNQDANK